jgi:hypothetical protein
MDGAAGYASPRRDGRGAIGIRQDCRLCQPPCQRGEEMAEPTEGGFVRPAWRFHPARGFVSRLGRSWGKNPSTACGGPPPFGKGGWRRRELRLRGWPFRRPRGGWRRTRPRHRSAPLAKGGRSWRSLRRGDSFFRLAWRFHPARGFVSRLGRSWRQESLHRLRRSPSLWQGRLAKEGAAS